MKITRLILGLVLLAGLCGSSAAQDKVSFSRGSAARQAWDKPMQPRIDSAPLRETVSALCAGRRLAWILDRRLDPDQTVTYTAGSAPLSEVFDSLLQPLSAQAVFMGDTIVIGPQEHVQWLRTLAELQRTELQQSGLSAAKISQLSRPVAWTWPDVTEPRQIVELEARKLAIPMQGLDRLSYDLWGSGSLAGMTPGEALTIIAAQYDFRVRWNSGGKAELVPIELPIQVSRVLPNFTLSRQIVNENLPDLRLESQNGTAVEARGRIEDIETLEKLVKGTVTDRKKPKAVGARWRAEKYSLKVENAPVIEVLTVLKQQGIPVEWDEKELTDAGVDLKQKINLEHKNATADVLIQDLCQQAGIECETRAQGIVLKVR